MREIIFDTETTGLHPYPKDGNIADRIVEIGAIEIVNLKPTGRIFHKYINPERDIPADAFKIHGIDNKKIADSPVFAEIVDDWIAFIGDDSKLVAHNANFDIRFINAEISRCGKSAVDNNRVIDTLDMAKTKFPGQSNTLDALCDRFNINNAHRKYHGALLDSELLYEVYLELRGGRQQGFKLATPTKQALDPVSAPPPKKTRLKRTFPISDTERIAHKDFVQKNIKDSLWSKKALFDD